MQIPGIDELFLQEYGGLLIPVEVFFHGMSKPRVVLTDEEVIVAARHTVLEKLRLPALIPFCLFRYQYLSC